MSIVDLLTELREALAEEGGASSAVVGMRRRSPGLGGRRPAPPREKPNRLRRARQRLITVREMLDRRLFADGKISE